MVNICSRVGVRVQGAEYGFGGGAKALHMAAPGFEDVAAVVEKEGRLVTVELKHFICMNAYVPNSGQKLERLTYVRNYACTQWC